MGSMRFFGTFESVEAVLSKVVELTSQEYSEREIYAISRDESMIELLRKQTEVRLYGVNSFEGSKHAPDVDELIRGAFQELGFSDNDSTYYYEEVKNGGIAVFVGDKDGSQLIKADSSVEISESGELLDSQNDNEQVTTPRINTEKL